MLIHSFKAVGQAVPIPASYSIIDTVFGDLDKDGINELVVAYNTKKENEDSFESVPRELETFLFINQLKPNIFSIKS